jgi:GntR family transcriptional regulator / MocR family aminotransferase
MFGAIWVCLMVPLEPWASHRTFSRVPRMLSEYLLSHFQQTPRGSALALNRQLYLALRDALRQGKVAAGERLPSSRDLAHDLQLSRNTVMTAL